MAEVASGIILAPSPVLTRVARRAWRLRRLPLIPILFLTIFVVAGLTAPLISPHNPERGDIRARLQPPAWSEGGSTEYLLGTDHLGRDILSRVVYGARISLYAGLLSAFVGCTIGMFVAVISVHFGGITDLVIQRIVDTMIAFPTLILAIAIMAALGASLNNVVIALSIAYVPLTTRILRAQGLAVNEMDYILAARAVGASAWRIMTRHMIPNLLALYIVIVTYYLGAAIIAEAALSFLGVGTPPDVPSWGGMLSKAAANTTIAPWTTVLPGLAIFIVVFAWNVLGDALRDILDPRLRGTGAGG